MKSNEKKRKRRNTFVEWHLPSNTWNISEAGFYIYDDRKEKENYNSNLIGTRTTTRDTEQHMGDKGGIVNRGNGDR